MSELLAVKPDAKRENTKKFFYRFCAVVGLICQSVFTIAYLIGLISVFGQNYNPISAFEMILEIFSFRRVTAYRNIVGLIAGVLYFIFLIQIIREFITAIKHTVLLRAESASVVRKSADKVIFAALTTFGVLMLFSFLSFQFAEGTISGWMILLMILTGLIALLRHLYNTVYTDNSVGWKTLSICRRCMEIVIVMLIYGLCCFDSGEQAINGVAALFKGYMHSESVKTFLYVFYNSLAEHILFTVLACVLMAKLKTVLYRGATAWEVTAQIVLALVSIVAAFVFKVYLSYENMHLSFDMVKAWYYAVSTRLLPIFLLSCGLWITDRLYK